MVKYMCWLLNFSMQPAKFNTTASAISSKRHTFWHLLCFFQRKKGFAAHSRALSIPVFALPAQYHTHLIQLYESSRVVNPPRAGCRLPRELRGNYSILWLKPSAGKVWMLVAFLTGLFQAIKIKKEHFFYLSCFYLLSHHNLITFLHGFYIITELI